MREILKKSTSKTEGKSKGEKAATVPIISNKFAAPMAKLTVMNVGLNATEPKLSKIVPVEKARVVKCSGHSLTRYRQFGGFSP